MSEMDLNAFPATIVTTVARNLRRFSLLNAVLMRPLRPIDPNYCMGVFTFDWTPGQGSYAIGQEDPQHAIYHLRIQAMVKHTDEELGLKEHSVLSKTLRAMLYRDPQLRAELTALEETSFGVIERLKHYTVQAQRFMTNEITQGTYVYLSSMDVNFNVEHTKL
jgi:hypothetical protein